MAQTMRALVFHFRGYLERKRYQKGPGESVRETNRDQALVPQENGKNERLGKGEERENSMALVLLEASFSSGICY